MKTLAKAGLMPKDAEKQKRLEKLDPYWLRREALDRRIRLCEIGRAIFHINQRRGFKSNRIADSENDEKSAMKQGVKALEETLKTEGVRTLGEFLALQHGRDRFGKRGRGTAATGIRFRPKTKGGKNLYDLYPTRLMAAQEIDEIWKKQKEFHPEQLTDDLLKRIKRIVIEQRPLKKPVVGNCTFFPEEERAPKAHPLFQRFRISQDVCQLRVVQTGRTERPLTFNEYQIIVGKLSQLPARSVKFEKLRMAIALDNDRFNYEAVGRYGFQTDETARILAARKAFGSAWHKQDLESRIDIVERLLAETDETVICNWLHQDYDLDQAAAEYISGVRLPQGYGRFGRTALRRLVEIMDRDSREARDPDTGEAYLRPLTYDEAVESLGLHHSDLRPDKLRARLPYYGEVLTRHVMQWPNMPEGSQEAIGRVTNPTVHIGLNQLRKIVNALISEYGPPQETAIELARELKLNKEQKDRINQRNQENRDANENNREILENLGYAVTHDNMLRLRLFYELPAEMRHCVYCEKSMGMEMLFTAIEIDHILPYSKTLDDSFPNKILCCRECNRRKGNRAPEETWNGVELEEICERAICLFPGKAWRFAPGAMEKFSGDSGFLARQLTDTQHVSRLAKAYLEHICETVHAYPGRLTAMLRARWGLNNLLPDHNRTAGEKNRHDHRHHAIDAFVVACTDIGLLKRIAQASGRAEKLNINCLYPRGEFPFPFEGYREALRDRLGTLVVSHRPDHRLPPGGRTGSQITSGKLLEDTAYGLVDDKIDGQHFNLVIRKPLIQLTSRMINHVRAPYLRRQLQIVAEKATQTDTKLEDALAKYGEKHNVRRVRILETKQSVREIKHGDGYRKAYVPDENHCIEIYELPNGTWNGEGITTFDVDQSDFKAAWRSNSPNSKLIMRVHKGDLIEADFGGRHRIYQVCRLEISAKRLRLALHNEGGSLQKRHEDNNDSFRYEMKSFSKLKDADARLVQVDPLGRVKPRRRAP